MQTKQTTKPASKPATKQASKAKTKTLFYAALLADCLLGKYGTKIQSFYANATSHHAKRKTNFPRPEYANVPLLNEADAVAFIQKHELTSIPNAKKESRRLFDEMMVQAKASK